MKIIIWWQEIQSISERHSQKSPHFRSEEDKHTFYPFMYKHKYQIWNTFFFIFKLAGDPIYLRDPWPLIRPHYLTDSHVKYADIYMIVSSLLFFQGVDGNYEGNNGLPGVTGPPGPQVHNNLYVRTLTFLLQQIFWLMFSCILSSRAHLVLQVFLWVLQSLYSFV